MVMTGTTIRLLDDVNDREYLGKVFMYELRDTISVSVDELRDQWLRLGFNANLLPKTRAASDAFRVAMAPHKRADKLGQIVMEYKLGSKFGYAQAYVFTKTTPESTEIAHDYVKRAVFGLTGTGDFRVEENALAPLNDNERTFAYNLRKEYQRLTEEITGNQIRTSVKNALQAMHAIHIHYSTYIVPSTNADELDRLIEFIHWLDNHVPHRTERNKANVVIFGDVPEQREQLRDYIRHHIDTEIQQKIGDIIKAKQTSETGKLTERRKSTIVGELIELRQTINEYEKVLSEPLDSLKFLLQTQEALVYSHLNS